jgi:hypothetical protein
MEDDLKILELQPLNTYSSHFKLKPEVKIYSKYYNWNIWATADWFFLNFLGPDQNRKLLEMKMTSHWRRPHKLKVEYLSNHWLDLPQILNLSWGDQTKWPEIKTNSNGRRPHNIKFWIAQQPLIRSSSNFELKLRGPNQMAWNRDELQWKTNTQYTILNSSATTYQIFLKFWTKAFEIDQHWKLLETKMTSIY